MRTWTNFEEQARSDTLRITEQRLRDFEEATRELLRCWHPNASIPGVNLEAIAKLRALVDPPSKGKSE